MSERMKWLQAIDRYLAESWRGGSERGLRHRAALGSARLLWLRLGSIAWVWKGTEHVVWFRPRLGHRRHYTQPYEPPKVSA